MSDYDAITAWNQSLTNVLGEHDALEQALDATQTELAHVEAQLEQANTALAGESASGEQMPCEDLPGWALLWADDFDTDVPLGQFPGPYAPKVGVYPTNYYDTSRNVGRPADKTGQYNAPRTISVTGSVLRKRLHTEQVRPMVAAVLPMLGPKTGQWTYQLYGRYAVRARIPAPTPGYKFAWLLWPVSNSARADGEIDWPESNFDKLDTVSAFLHYTDAANNSDQYAKRIPCDLTAWHTYVIEWVPGEVRFLLDDVLIGSTTSRTPDTPMRWVLQTETAITPTPPAVDVQGDVEIDWAVVWSYRDE